MVTQNSGKLMDIPITYTVDQIEDIKEKVIEKSKLFDLYVRAIAWWGSGTDMGVASENIRFRMAVAAWEWPSYMEPEAREKGIIEKYINGCLLPHLVLVLSDQIPINGSENASNTKAIAIAEAVKIASNPNTWL